MALTKKKNKNQKEKHENLFENKKGLEKLYLYFTIVPSGQGKSIIDLFEYVGSSAQYIQKAEGTAPSDLLNILNITDNKKDVVVSFIKESLLDEMEKEINAFFKASKKNQGLAFAIPLASLIGVRMYKFLTKTM